MARVLVMSIKPKYANRIFAGTKTVELRRARPHVDAGDIVVVYASSPVKSLVGAFTVGGVISEPVARMWKQHTSALGVSRKDYDDYFDGTDLAHGLLVAASVAITPVPLDVLRRRAAFRPPQSYMFWVRSMAQLVPPAARSRLESLWGMSAAAE